MQAFTKVLHTSNTAPYSIKSGAEKAITGASVMIPLTVLLSAFLEKKKQLMNGYTVKDMT